MKTTSKKNKPVDPTSAERQRRYIRRLKAAAKEDKKTKKIKIDNGPVEVMLPAEFMNGVFHQLDRLVTTVQLIASYLATEQRPRGYQIQPPEGSTVKYRSGEWHMRSGNIFQKSALPGTPNAEEAPAAAAQTGTTADDPGRHLSSSQ